MKLAKLETKNLISLIIVHCQEITTEGVDGYSSSEYNFVQAEGGWGKRVFGGMWRGKQVCQCHQGTPEPRLP